jgi:hypothetical protein
MPFRPIKHPKMKVKSNIAKRKIIKLYDARHKSQTE